jgi:type I restriction enzyme S subunit
MGTDSEVDFIPSGWRTQRLDEICSIRSGGTPPKSDPTLWAGTFPWVSGKDLKRNRLTDSLDHITREAAETFSEIAPGGSVLALVRGMGLVNSFAVSLIERPMAFNQDLKALIPRGEVTGAFLVHALRFAGRRMLRNVTDAAHGTKRLSQDDLRGFELPVPSLEEQAAIASVLDSVVTAIEIEADAQKKTDQLKATAMRELFTRGLRGEVQKETEIGPIPQSWECLQFGNVRERLQYGTSVRCTTRAGTHPVLRIPNLVGGRISSGDLKYCDLPDEQAQVYLLQKGDLLFVRTNGVIDRLGSCAVYEGLPTGALFASYLIRARVKPILVPQFAAFFFGSERGTSLIVGRATPAADGKYNLNTGIIDSLPIPLPPTVDEQHGIVAILEAIDHKIQLHKRKRALLEDLFKSLLHNLMTGQIRVSDLTLSALQGMTAAQVSA